MRRVQRRDLKAGAIGAALSVVALVAFHEGGFAATHGLDDEESGWSDHGVANGASKSRAAARGVSAGEPEAWVLGGDAAGGFGSMAQRFINYYSAALQDLSGDVKYEVADPKIARVSTSGRVIPLANGRTEDLTKPPQPVNNYRLHDGGKE